MCSKNENNVNYVILCDNNVKATMSIKAELQITVTQGF